MKLLHIDQVADRMAKIFHNENNYVIELYIGDRLYRKLNIMENLVDAKQLVEIFLSDGRNQQLLREDA